MAFKVQAWAAYVKSSKEFSYSSSQLIKLSPAYFAVKVDIQGSCAGLSATSAQPRIWETPTTRKQRGRSGEGRP
jgi:hypothetical protein